MRKAILLCVVAAACTPTDEAAVRAEALFAELEPGWNEVHGGEGTSCSHGTDYSFSFLKGDPEKLAVFFDGGGACWFGENCALDRSPSYTPAVDESDDPTNATSGIFDLDNPANPVSGWSMLFVPYCTADVHVGAATTAYDVGATDSLPAGSVEIRHQSDANAQTALSWVYDRIVAPTDVLVTGVSAGAIGSAFHAHEVAAHFPEANVVQLGDAAGGYRVADRVLTQNVLSQWGTNTVFGRLEGIDMADVDFEDLYADNTRVAPNLRMSQINFHEDEVQLGFLALLGQRGEPLAPLLDANLDDIEAASPSFRSFTIAGTQHGILHADNFYETEVDGVSLRDWTADLISGGEVETVACKECRGN